MASHAPGADAATVQIPQHVYDRRWWTLAILCLSLMVVIVGNTALNVALPTLARELNASTSAQQWMVDAYGLVFAGFLFTAGTLGDRYGRKGALQFGLLTFLTGSLLAAFLGTSSGVIIGRTIMGFGAAFVMPATLSVLTNVFPPAERGRAIGIWAGIAGGGAAIGPVASGFLLEHFSWGSVFLVNVPIIAVALIAGYFLVPTSRDPDPGALDPLGALLSIAGLGTLVYAIIEAPHHGWASSESLLLFGLAILLLGAFLLWELRNSAPMLDLRYFLDRRFSVAAGTITLVYFAMFGTFFLLTQYFQLVLGYGTLETGVKQLPFALIMMVTAPQGMKVSARYGTHRVVAFGLVGVAIGMAFLSQTTTDTSYWYLLIPIAFLSSGMALTFPSMTASIMSAVPLTKAGVGSAMNDTTRELGGALGVAVLGSLVASRYDAHISSTVSSLPADVKARANESLAGALEVSGRLGGNAGGRVAQVAREAYVSGFHLATTIAGIVLLVASFIVYRLLPRPEQATVATPEAEADEPGVRELVPGLDG
jgi:EmrB/QacA subfamily drug resistance transporter